MTVTTQGSILGHRVLRVEDRELITGAGDYTADLPEDGAYHACFVRSVIAHGTLTSIACDEARAMPGFAPYIPSTRSAWPRGRGCPGWCRTEWPVRTWPGARSASSVTSWPS